MLFSSKSLKCFSSEIIFLKYDNLIFFASSNKSSNSSNFFLLGNTHIQMKKKINKKTILNPGSVGQPRDGSNLAKWLIIDTKTKKIDFKKTKFNSKNIIEQINTYDPKNKRLAKYFQK